MVILSISPHLKIRNCLQAALAFAVLTTQGFSPLLSPAHAALKPEQVLVLFNSQGSDADGNGVADSVEVFELYADRNPGVIGFDLDNAAIQSRVLTHAEYEDLIRDPVRSFLDNSIPGGNGRGGDISAQIVVITLTQGLPVRIDDTDNAGLGNRPGDALDELTDGDATYASVDAELALLWQAGSAGEAGGRLDAPFIDNALLNPYHGRQAPIDSFDRSGIKTALRTEAIGANADLISRLLDTNGTRFRLDDEPADPGDIYLTTRLAGRTVDDAIALIDRGGLVIFDVLADQLIFDENAAGSLDDAAIFVQGGSPSEDPAYQGDDYDEAASAADAASYQALVFDETSRQLIGENVGAFKGTASTTSVTGRVALLATYGGNHNEGNSDNEGFIDTFAGQLAKGAIYLSAESFAGRTIDGGAGFLDQADVLDWVAHGGTFAIVNPAEPFAFSLADAELITNNFLLGELTWAEAAWTAIPYLSWQHVVIGDPLATVLRVQGPPVDAEIFLAPRIRFVGQPGILYDVVRITDGGEERIIATVEGTGQESVVADITDLPLTEPRRYEVRVVGLQ